MQFKIKIKIKIDCEALESNLKCKSAARLANRKNNLTLFFSHLHFKLHFHYTFQMPLLNGLEICEIMRQENVTFDEAVVIYKSICICKCKKKCLDNCNKANSNDESARKVQDSAS